MDFEEDPAQLEIPKLIRAATPRSYHLAARARPPAAISSSRPISYGFCTVTWTEALVEELFQRSKALALSV